VNRQEIEHILGAAANITGEDEFVVIGSQAILGTHPTAPPELLVSMEADIYPLNAPDKAIEIDGSLGDGSMFHRTFGYYAHGVGPETAKAPAGWEERLLRIAVQPRLKSSRHPVGYFLEIHDLVVAKCVAGRDRDIDYVARIIEHALVRTDVLLERIPLLPGPDEVKERVLADFTQRLRASTK
jgi:hypothetical protein